MEKVGLATQRSRLLKVLLPLASAALLSRAGVLVPLCVRLGIFALRSSTPLALVATAGTVLGKVLAPGGPQFRSLARGALLLWAASETIFYAYIMQCWRQLERQTTVRWQAVRAHSTEEKRRSSMERYLLALAQVCCGGVSAKPERLALSRTHSDPATAEKSSKNQLKRRPSLATGFSSSNLLGGLAGVSREQSVDDFLKMHEGKQISDDELQRLHCIELASFFKGPGRGDPENPAEWLQRGNVEEWIAHYWFRGATPEDLDGRPERKELSRLTDMLLGPAGLINIPPGRNPQLMPYRLFADPMPVVHRPLFVYAITSLLCPLLTLKVMSWLGFTRERVGGLSYWRRKPKLRASAPAAFAAGASADLAGPHRTPMVFAHGLGVGLVPYFRFICRLARQHSGDLFVPEFPFLAMAPYETVPSAREIVAQLQDMLAANGHAAAHFVGHSFGGVVVGWMMKMSPGSVVFTTLMEPANFLMIKSEAFVKVLYGTPRTSFEFFVCYLVFRELFTVNLLCRNLFWEQSTFWPEDLHVPAVVELASADHIVQSLFARRLLEHERAARRQRRKDRKLQHQLMSHYSRSSQDIGKEATLQSHPERDEKDIDILWCEDFYHGEVLDSGRACEKLFAKMRQMVHSAHGRA